MPQGKSSLYILTPAEISPEFISWPLGFGLTQSHPVITCGLITSDLMPHTVPGSTGFSWEASWAPPLYPTDTCGPTPPHSLTPPRARPQPTHPTPPALPVSQHRHHKQITSAAFATKLLTIYYSCTFNWAWKKVSGQWHHVEYSRTFLHILLILVGNIGHSLKTHSHQCTCPLFKCLLHSNRAGLLQIAVLTRYDLKTPCK